MHDRYCIPISKIILRTMKLTLILVALSIVNCLASAYSQKVSLNLNNVKFSEAIHEISRQTKLDFAYSKEVVDMNRTVSIFATNTDLKNVLDQLLNGTQLMHVELNGKIYFGPKEFESIIQSAFLQQQKKIIGTVVDAITGEPLPGVTVMVQGTTKGTTTSTEGKFTLDLPNANAVLVFSFIGYETQKISTLGKSVFNVKLKTDVKQLDEVVVVGYGTQSKTKLISSVASLKTKDIVNTPYTNLGTALAGRIAGVIVQSSGGEPGSIPSISIRGGADPLYVIDGLIRSKSDFIALSKEDISSINVLKDASATAVYGARGANGIVLVTTKQGDYGETVQIRYTSNFAWNTLAHPLDLISSYNRATAANAISQAGGLGPYSQYSKEIIDTIKNGLNPARYPNTNWYKTLMRDYAPQQEQSLSVSGGTEKTKYFFGVGYLNQGGVFQLDVNKYNRYNYRSNVTTKFDKIGLDVSLNLNGYIINKKLPSETAQITIMSPLERPYNPNGTISAVVFNPLADIKGPGYQKENTYYNDGSLVLSWTVPGIKGLKLKVLGDYSTNVDNQDNFSALASQYDELGIQRVNSAPSKYLYQSKTLAYNIEGQVDYVRSFGKHNMSFTVVSTTSAGNNDWFSASRNNYLSTAVDQLFAGSSGSMTNDGNASEWGRVGYVGRAKYDYANKYFMELSGRYDGSDNFPNVDNKRWGFFPSAALGWNISEEKFFSPLKNNKIFDMFKIRGSLGTIGNDNVSRYAYIASYNMNSQIFVSGGNLMNGFSEGNLVSNNLSWYSTKSYNIGFDFATLNSHLTGSFDYFYTRTTGYLTSPAARYIDPLGKSLPQIKSDAAYRKGGVDGSITYNNKIGKVSYGIGLNITYYNSLWEKSNEDSVTLANPYTRSQGTYENYNGSMYTSLGFYQTFDQVLNNPRSLTAASLAPGDVRYKDENGDGKIDAQDYRKQGNSSSPRFVFGVDLSAEYKGIRFNALIQGTGKRNIYMGSYLQAPEENRYNFNYQTNYWTPNNIDARYPRAASSSLNSANNYAPSSFWLLNAQFIRLKSLTISYDLKKTILNNQKWFDSFSVFVSGTNLLTVSPCTKYFDPETSSANNDGYPVTETLSIGINLGF